MLENGLDLHVNERQKKCGWPVLLGEELDEKMKMYLQKVRDREGVVTRRIAIAAA